MKRYQAYLKACADIKSPRQHLVEELAATVDEEIVATTRGELAHAADLRKAANALRDRLSRMPEVKP